MNVLAVRLTNVGTSAEGRSKPDINYLRNNVQQFIDRAAAYMQREGSSPLLVLFAPEPVSWLKDGSYAEQIAAIEELAAHQLRSAGAHVCTAADILNLYPIEEYVDPVEHEFEHSPDTGEGQAAIGAVIARLVRALIAVPFKVLVFDLDNTLWTGVTEEGVNGVVLDEKRLALQQFLIAQRRAGTILGLCSKRAEFDFEEVFVGPEVRLSRDDVICLRANGQSKGESLRALAADLSLDLDSFIFVSGDDQECAEVAARCPSVLTIAIPPDGDSVVNHFRHFWVFDMPPVTNDFRRHFNVCPVGNGQNSLLRNQNIAMLAKDLRTASAINNCVARVAAHNKSAGQLEALQNKRRTKCETELISICKHALGIPAMGVNDDFFDLGIDSNTIVRIAALIQKKLSYKVGIATVQAARTVANLAAALVAPPGQELSSNPVGPSGHSCYTSLTICLLNRGGVKRPLFLMRPSSTNGGALAYAPLARHLDSQRPLYILQNRPLLESRKPYGSIQEMAVEYVDAIRTIQPEGPYLVGGLCLGGKTAFEVATQLWSGGQRVAMLLIIEALSPNTQQEQAQFLDDRTLAQLKLRLFARYPNASKILTSQNSLIRRFELIAYHDYDNHDVDLVCNAFPARFERATLQKMSPDEMWEHVYKSLKCEVGGPASYYEGDAAIARRGFKHFANDHQLDALYTPSQRYQGPVTFFTVRGNNRAGVGWMPFIAAPPKLYDFDVKVIKDGSNAHNSLMAEENVKPVAAELNRLLDDIAPLS